MQFLQENNCAAVFSSSESKKEVRLCYILMRNSSVSHSSFFWVHPFFPSFFLQAVFGQCFLLRGLNSNQNFYRVKWLFQRQVYLLIQTFIHEGKNLWNRLGAQEQTHRRPDDSCICFSVLSAAWLPLSGTQAVAGNHCGQQINRIKWTRSHRQRTGWSAAASSKSIVSWPADQRITSPRHQPTSP